MKKLLSIALCSLLAVSMFTACGDKDDDKEEKTTKSPDSSETGEQNIEGKVTFLTCRTDLDQDGTYGKYIAKFNEQYPDVTVEVESITDYAGELAIRMQTKEYGDVLMIPDAVPTNTYADYFVPLGTVDELKDKYTENYLYSKWYDNQVYGLAYMCTVQGIVYNKQVFKDAGIETLPKSPDEFLTALKAIKEKTDAIPYYTNTNSGWPLVQWEDHCFGTSTGDPDYKNNKMITDEAPWVEGGSHYAVSKLLYDIVDQELCEEDPATCEWEASKLMMNDGEIGCMVLGSWAIQQMKDAGEHADNVGYMPFPVTVDGKQYATSGTDYCYAINKNTKYPEAARAFIDFMVDESGLALASGGISLLKDDPMPNGLENFKNIEFVVDKPATDENLGVLDEVQADSGITLYDNGARLSVVVDIAKGSSSQSFEDYMAQLNKDWSSAIK